MVIYYLSIVTRQMLIIRYFCEDGVSPLWEKWFHCEDLGTQLGPIIKE